MDTLSVDELRHHGIRGMKWGVRRYQNADGSLTAAGKKKYGTKTNFEKVKRAKQLANGTDPKTLREKARAQAKANTEKEIAKYMKKAGKAETIKEESKKANSKSKSIHISEATDEELERAINRKRLEDRYKEAFKKEDSFGKQFINTVKDSAISGIKNAAGKAAQNFVEKKLSERLGLDKPDEYTALKKTVDTLDLKKRMMDTQDYINTFKEKQRSDDLRRAASNATNAKRMYETEQFFKEEAAKNAQSRQDAANAAQNVYDATRQTSNYQFLLEDKKKKK